MADTKILSDVTVVVNNSVVSVVPNSVRYTEGKGEQSVKTASSGGSKVQLVYSENIENRMSKVMFSMFPTETNIGLARTWKNNENSNVVFLTSGTSFTKTFTNAVLTNDYEINLAADGAIEMEFHCDAAV